MQVVIRLGSAHNHTLPGIQATTGRVLCLGYEISFGLVRFSLKLARESIAVFCLTNGAVAVGTFNNDGEDDPGIKNEDFG